MSDITAEKDALRRRLRAWRRDVTPERRQAAAEAAARRRPPFPVGAVIALYWPAAAEFDCRPLAAAYAADGHVLALPTTPEGADRLIFRLWTPDAPLIPGRFALEPGPEAPILAPDVVIAPLVGFDRRCNRLGQGGGWYDRSLAALAAQGRRPFVLGLAYAGQEVPDIPVALGEDQPLDAVLTESDYFQR